MSDWMLLYLFTRLDEVGGVIGMLGCVAFVVCVVAFGFSVGIDDDWKDERLLERALRKKAYAGLIAKRAAIVIAILLPIDMAMPTQKDVAIIVGGSLAIDAARSDDAKEIAGEVMAAIRAKLREAAKE